MVNKDVYINVRQHYFAERVVSVWNTLSPSVVDFSSLSAFKRTIHNVRLNLFTDVNSTVVLCTC